MRNTRFKAVIALLLCFALIASQLVFGDKKVQASYMPLDYEEVTVDLSDFFPEDLRHVSLSDLLANMTDDDTGLPVNQLSGNVVGFGYSNDSYEIVNEGDTFDLISYTSFANYHCYDTIYLICGNEADQLNKTYKKYIVSVNGPADLMDSVDEVFYLDSNPQTQVPFDRNVYQYGTYIERDYKPTDDTWNGIASLRMKVDCSLQDITMKIYENRYTSVNSIPSTAQDIASQLIGNSAEGYLFSSNSGLYKYFTYVFEKGTSSICVPIRIYIYSNKITVEPNVLYAYNGQDSDSYLYNYPYTSYENGVEKYTYRLYKGISATDEYYCLFRYSKNYDTASYSDQNIVSNYISKAVVGLYNSLSEASEQTDIKDVLLKRNYGFSGGDGYRADYSSGVSFTFFTTDEQVIHYTIQTVATSNEPRVGIGWYSDLYAEINGRYEDITDNNSSADNDGVDVYTYTLKEGYSASTECMFKLYASLDRTSDDNLSAMVKKAVVGLFDSYEAVSSQADIKNQLFSNVGNGYAADYSSGVSFTVFTTDGQIRKYTVHAKVKELTPYFHVTGVQGDNASYSSFTIASGKDSYYNNGFQAVLFLDSINGAVVTGGAVSIKPVFSVTNGANVYVDDQPTVSGQNAYPYVFETPLSYGVTYNWGIAKNYLVSFLSQVDGPKLFINGLTDTASYVQDGNDMIPSREVIMSSQKYHDIFFANVGSEPIDGLYVRLSDDATNVKLDPYWTIGNTKTLSPFTTTDSGQSGLLSNIGKIRLIPVNENAMGQISGTLIIGYGDENNGEEIKIKLTGFAGTPEITTDNLYEGVKYVPYSVMLRNNMMYMPDAVSYKVTDGEIPDWLTLEERSGELWGIPMEAATGRSAYDFEVTLTFSYTSRYSGETITAKDSKWYHLEIGENTRANIDELNRQQGYSEKIEDKLPEELDLSVVSGPGVVFHSEGPFGDFMEFYLDGNKLNRDSDYSAEDGSTKITIFEKTFEDAGLGEHTIAATFRDGGQASGEMKPSAAIVTITKLATPEPVPYTPSFDEPASNQNEEVTNPDGSTTKTTETKNADGSITVEKVTTAKDGTVITENVTTAKDGTVTTDKVTERPDGIKITENVVERPDGTKSAVSVTTDKDGNEVSKTTEEVTFTEKGTKVEEKETVNANGSSSYSLVKTKKSGKVDSIAARTTSKGKTTIEVGIVKANGSKINKKYTSKEDGTIKLTKYETAGANAVLPSTLTVNGKKYSVSAIAHDAFAGNEDITNVKLGKNVVAIGKHAFKGVSGMKKIIVYSTKIESVGKGAFNGIAPGAVFKLKMDKENYLAIRELFSAAAEKDVKFKRVK